MVLSPSVASDEASTWVLIQSPLTDFDLAEALALCSAQRRAQALRFRHEAGQRQSVAAYLLLCRALKERYGITQPPELTYLENGKPVLTAYPTIHFNLSHCREAAICAVSDHPVGVDIECDRRITPSLIRYAMNDEEQHSIFSATEPEWEFLRLWTMKEALTKLTGEGMSNHTKEVLREAQNYRFHTARNPHNHFIYTIAEHR